MAKHVEREPLLPGVGPVRITVAKHVKVDSIERPLLPGVGPVRITVAKHVKVDSIVERTFTAWCRTRKDNSS